MIEQFARKFGKSAARIVGRVRSRPQHPGTAGWGAPGGFYDPGTPS
jgi:hypothetical protein